MAENYALFSEEVLASMLQKADLDLFVLENKEPGIGTDSDHQLKVTFAQQTVTKLTDALQIKSRNFLKETSFTSDKRQGFVLKFKNSPYFSKLAKRCRLFLWL